MLIEFEKSATPATAFSVRFAPWSVPAVGELTATESVIGALESGPAEITLPELSRICTTGPLTKLLPATTLDG